MYVCCIYLYRMRLCIIGGVETVRELDEFTRVDFSLNYKLVLCEQK